MATIEEWLTLNERSGKPLSPLRQIVTLDYVKELIKRFDDDSLNVMEICITFKPELEAQWTTTTLADITEKQLRRSMKGKGSAILIGEYSDVGKWHYHGMVRGMAGDKISKLLRGCSRNLGRTQIKNIKYMESYKTYMTASYNKVNPKGNITQKWNPHSHIIINTT